MNIRLHQLNPVIGDLTGNRKLILDVLKQAELSGVDLLILPEMVVTGYPVQDLLERPAFREAVYEVNREIVAACKGTAILFGTMTPNETGKGRRMYNSAVLAKTGSIEGIVHKTLLPTYDVFDDLRYFEPNKEFKCLELDDIKLGVTICEDIWYNENEFQYHHYETDPASILKEQGADLIINVSASPFTITKHENRLHMLGKHADELSLPVLYCNQVGAHTEIVFEGGSMALSRNGSVSASTKAFQSSYADVEFSGSNRDIESKSAAGWYPDSKYERFFEAIKLGLKDYLRKTGITDNVVLGLSGGIDSALVAALAAETLGPERVRAITMPSEFSSEGSVSDSDTLATNLGIELNEIPINTLFENYRSSLSKLFGDRPFGVAEENIQSRIRGTLLMAYANKFGSFLLATGNKSEYAVGYATLYGDMNGALAPIGDLYKTDVYGLARWLNENHYKKEVIPNAIISKAPSAELRPDQRDSDSLPDYSILDSILYQYLELQRSVPEIVGSGIDEQTVKKIIALTDQQEFKRFQAAPIIKLTSKSFGTGRRQPLVQNWTSHETQN